MRFTTAIAGFAGLAAVNAISTIEIKGAKLFKKSDGSQFFVKGEFVIPHILQPH
jgi:hypothetical protein